MHDMIDRMVTDYDRGRLSRRQLIGSLTGMAAAMAVSRPVRAATGGEPTFVATDLNHLALRVTDLDRSQAFYEKHLGLAVTSRSESSCFMRCRDSNFLAMFKSDTPAMDHYCYSIPKYDAADAVERLKAAGLDPRRRENRVYFDDPDGLEVQVAAMDHGA